MSEITDTSEIIGAHEITSDVLTDEGGNVVPQLIVEGGEVNRAFVGELEVIGITLTLTDVLDGETDVAVLILSSELASELGRACTVLAASIRPLTKQIETRQAAEALTTDNEENSK